MLKAKSNPTDPGAVRAGIIGTGYIADFHANAIDKLAGVKLVSICDNNLNRAKSFASRWGVAMVHDSLTSMLKEREIDAVHILVPPDHHHAIASAALKAGIHVFLEKPICASRGEAIDILEIGRANNRLVAVNHNMLYAPAYQRLRNIVRSGDLGPLSHLALNVFQQVGPIRFGPFNSWMLRSPGNLVLEIGPHVFSVVLDLVGMPGQVAAAADEAVDVPGGARVFRRWRVSMTAEAVSVDVNMNFCPSFTSRTITVYGLFGTATADLDANTCVIDQNTTLGVDLDRYSRTRRVARQLTAQARETLFDYALSTLKLRGRGNPYETSIINSVASFYSNLRTKTNLDDRISGNSGVAVIDLCTRVAAAAAVDETIAAESRPARAAAVQPTVLVLGAGGFIGVELVKQLLGAGYSVRAMVRGGSRALEQMDNDHLEICRGDILVEAELERAMEGIEFVYHLARADAKTWEDYLNLDVHATKLVAEACQSKGVRRLVYAGTIDSYYAGRGVTITENTPLDPQIKRRNYYARAKAKGESILMEKHRTAGLPVVILRPGIVIGRGGPPFHGGVGMWRSGNVCQIWGGGENKLPFVLVADVAAAFVRSIQVIGIEGKSYNLIDVPLLSAREYLDQLQKLAGIKVRAYYQPVWRFFVADFFKWIVKVAVGHPDKIRIPSYSDWKSRTQRAQFDCTTTRNELGWAPASNRDRLVAEGIADALGPGLRAFK